MRQSQGSGVQASRSLPDVALLNPGYMHGVHADERGGRLTSDPNRAR